MCPPAGPCTVLSYHIGIVRWLDFLIIQHLPVNAAKKRMVLDLFLRGINGKGNHILLLQKRLNAENIMNGFAYLYATLSKAPQTSITSDRKFDLQILFYYKNQATSALVQYRVECIVVSNLYVDQKNAQTYIIILSHSKSF